MESPRSAIAEQPLLTIHAHIFHVNPETNKSWVPITSSAVPVSFCYNSAENAYRIIALNGKKLVLNSRMTGEMNFTKTSQKFGQWMDAKVSIVYGLGFSNESDLDDFVEQFDDLKEVLLMEKLNTQKLDTKPSNDVPNKALQNEKEISLAIAPVKVEPLLREENEKLKMALQQSIRNTSMVELEIESLKTNNAYLTSRLEECTQTMEEWKNQLDFFTEENHHLKIQLQDAETHGKQQMNKELIDEIEVLRNQIETNGKMLEEKEEEIKVLKESIAEYDAAKESTARLQSAFQRLKVDHETVLKNNEEKSQMFQDLNSQVQVKLAEIHEIHDKVMKL